jgi:hypothetical protein
LRKIELVATAIGWVANEIRRDPGRRADQRLRNPKARQASKKRIPGVLRPPRAVFRNGVTAAFLL